MYKYMTAVMNKCMEVFYRWYMKSTDRTKYTVEYFPAAGKFSRDPGFRFSTSVVCVCTYSIVKGYSSRRAKGYFEMIVFSL